MSEKALCASLVVLRHFQARILQAAHMQDHVTCSDSVARTRAVWDCFAALA